MVLTFRVGVGASRGKIHTVNIHLLPEMVLVPSAFQSLPVGKDSLFPVVFKYSLPVFTAVTEEGWNFGYLRKKTVVLPKCCLDHDLLSNILNFCVTLVLLL